jgi:excisionase family DNA binding protein
MSAAKLTVDLSPELLDQLADLVAKRLAPRREAWIGVHQAAAYIGCSRHRIYRLTAAGDIPFARDGRRLVFRKSALDSWLQEGSR